jgi:hypothetical protein
MGFLPEVPDPHITCFEMNGETSPVAQVFLGRCHVTSLQFGKQVLQDARASGAGIAGWTARVRVSVESKASFHHSDQAGTGTHLASYPIGSDLHWDSPSLVSNGSRPALGPTQPRIQFVPWNVSSVVKRPGREADSLHIVTKSRVVQLFLPPLRLHGKVFAFLPYGNIS